MKNHYVFHQNQSKSSTFDENPCRFFKKNAKLLKNHYVFHQNRSKSSTFDENPCEILRKTQKSEKTIMFYMKNCKKEQFCFILLMFFAFLTRGTLAEPFFEPAAQSEPTPLYTI